MNRALRPRGRVAGLGALLMAVSAAGLTVVSAGPAAAATQYTFYASPEVSNGSGRSCESVAAACSLTDARNKVRTRTSGMTGDIVVKLLGGTYSLSSTFTLSAASQDSGTNGYNVIYENYKTDIPVLSGGKKITGWTQYDSAKGIWSAPAPAGVDSRQLYVNGVRQARANGKPGTWTKTTTGWTISDGAVQNYKNLTNVELVGNHAWMQHRCPIASATATTVTMAQPCWGNANFKAAKFLGVTRVENAYELLDTAGEWYLDRTGAVAGNTSPRVYFKPANSSTLATDKVVLPALETLVSATGTSADKLRNVQFRNIRFEHATWTRPNSTEGYPTTQSGYLYYGTDHGKDSEDLFRTPGNVDVQEATNIRFEGNTFTRLGAVGLSVMKGTQDIAVVGNRFEDISSSAVSIGHINDHHPATDADIVKNVSFTDNYVVRSGAEYQDAVAVLAAYPQNLNLSHNEISNIPYTGISVGWGWGRNDVGGSNGYTTPTPLKDNTINNNYVHDYMKALLDGGGIYTHSNQPGTVVKYNHLRNSTGDTGLYPDEGTQNIFWENNVVAEMGNGNWLQMYSKISNTTARYNYTDSTKSVNEGTNNTISDNQTGLTSWPPAAQAIIAGAGIRPAYLGGGTTVSQGKPTTASSVQHTGVEAAKATDGNPYTRWASTFSDPQWLQIDLGQTHYITRVKLNWENAHGRAYQIQTSPDGTTWTPIYSTTTGDGGIDDLAVNGTGRYVRMYGTARGTQYGYSLYEMTVDGRTTPPTSVKQTNLALNAKATTSSTWPHPTYDPSFAVDGRVRDDAGYGNRWLANGSLFPSTVTLDLGANYALSRIKHTSSETDGSTWKYKLEGSTNSSTWTTLADHTVDAVADGTTDTVSGTYRYVRLTLTWAANYHWPSSNEFEVYGTTSTDPS